MLLPSPRGPFSRSIVDALRGSTPPEGSSGVVLDADTAADPLVDDDLHLALFLCYELHYGGLEGVRPEMEWDTGILARRAHMETLFMAALRERLDPVIEDILAAGRSVEDEISELIACDDAPSVSGWLARWGTEEMYREFLMHRSAYHLKEADPHTFAIPRLRGRAKAAMVEIQADEYGGGDPAWMHSALFARSMRALGLDDAEGAFVDLLPGATLATVNLLSMFGLHRALRGAAVGHLAVFELTSCIPNRRYAQGLRRLGYGPEATTYFDEHVEADAAHGSIALTDLAGALAADEPALRRDIVFGAAALNEVDRRWATHVMGAWTEGRTSLRPVAAVTNTPALIG